MKSSRLNPLPSFSSLAMAMAGNIGPMDAPWNTPDPLTCVQQLQGLVGHGFSVGHDSTGDLQALMQSALGGIRKEVDQHMDFLETEHVEQKTDPLHSSKTYTMGDAEQDIDQTYYQWTRMQNLPGWWVKKVWHSYDGWLLVAKKEEFSLLIPDAPVPLDQRSLVEETLSSESSMENQRQNMGANMARQALQNFLRLPDGTVLARERSRSPRGAAEAANAAAMPMGGAAEVSIEAAEEVTMPQAH